MELSVKPIMLEKERYYKLNLKKNCLIVLFLILINNESFASPKDKIINNLKKIENLSFSFEQKIENNIETGNCIIQYPKLLYCIYNNKDKKEMISNGNSLVIKNNRYNKTYRYPLNKTPLEKILDKKFLISKIRNLKPIKNNRKLLEFSFSDEKNLLLIFFDNKNFDIAGWKTIDVYQKEVIFKISDLKKNLIINKKKFVLPKSN